MLKKSFKFFSTCLILSLALVGCGQQTEDENPLILNQEVQQALSDASYINGELQNFVVTASVSGISEQAIITGTLKQDRRGAVPITQADGQVDVAGIKADVSMYSDEEMIVTTIGGDTGKVDLTEEQKQQQKDLKANQVASMTDIKKVVTLSEENGKKMLTVIVEKDDIADFFLLQPISFVMEVAVTLVDNSSAEYESMEVEYILSSENEVQEIRYNMAVSIGEDGDGMTITGTLKINDFGHVSIEKPDIAEE